ncbi:phytoene dehydrogenase [Massilia sp. Root351]|jgi:squalene-associated FAD-dependent desaturase|uniref:hydroxysqualene dehydroxylase HpnE n=1 Tax=Massilia sp. Root351 TaxID=1736522 RepID=UPI00070FB98F|nr:hydroxysqualene dehydroxylase HpnE [Massilia sp. Root351]KQV82533.1 phytoene dehydrogenase [Massilia sp. Root351]
MTRGTARTVAVVGAGWAGCAAALELARAGCTVTLLEAARTLGGRARRVEMDGRQLDNGQHIMLGAYAESLRVMKLAGVDLPAAMLSLPLQMRYAPGAGGMDFLAPRLPAPLHLLGALLRAKGLAREDKLSLARFSTTARWMDWQLNTDCSVDELLQRFDQTPRLIQLMWRPLCLAALNTPTDRASAQVFLNVLRDSLGARRKASDMLIPRADLTALFPDAAAACVARRGGTVHAGAKVTALAQLPDGRWRLSATGAGLAQLAGPAAASGAASPWSAEFDAVILALGAPGTAAMLRGLAPLQALATQLEAFTPEAITTCYLQYDGNVRLGIPFYALLDNPDHGHWGQFVFDRGQLDAAQAGMLAVVISASGKAAGLGQAALAAAIAAQLAAVLRRPELAQPSWSRVVTEKRATYACTPALARPANATGLPGLLLAGDYTAGDDAAANYPATLESAVRSGVAAVKILLKNK